MQSLIDEISAIVVFSTTSAWRSRSLIAWLFEVNRGKTPHLVYNSRTEDSACFGREQQQTRQK